MARALAADPPVLLMDEPFGAIDPVTRTRLQDEFLRLQDELRKTVVFVTHDIDEAVKMGTRIVLLNVGGHLEQYDTPAMILGRPATPFVADFVGRDRALKRLQVTAIARDDVTPLPAIDSDADAATVAAALDSAHANRAIVVDAAAPGELALVERFTGTDRAAQRALPIASIPATASLEEALALVLLGESGAVAVVDRGRPLGILTIMGIHRSLRRSLSENAVTADDDAQRPVVATEPALRPAIDRAD